MKDPAFLFYSSDFLTGTMTMTMEERGQYITLLALIHQKGHLKIETIRLIVGNVSDNLLEKFEQDENGMYFNKRLEIEIEKRRSFTDSRRENGKKGGRPSLKKITESKPNGLPNGIASANHTESVNENVIVNEIKGQNSTFEFIPPISSTGKKTPRKSSTPRGNVADNPPELTLVKTYWIENTVHAKEPREYIWTEELARAQAEEWYKYQESSGWMVGTKPMRNWRSASATGIGKCETWGRIPKRNGHVDNQHKDFNRKVNPL